MAISTYGELKTAIQNWQYNATDIATYAADIVTLSQGYINRRLRCREMITQSTLTISAGLFALPSNFLQWRTLVESASTRRPLINITYEEADDLYPTRPAGSGIYFAFIGTNIRVYPTPANDVELTYYAKLSAFASDSATDWLLAKMPNVYLAAGQMYAAEFLKEDSEVAKHAGIVDMYISMLNAEDDSNEFASTSMQPDGFTP